jgi:hypothetical protein
MLTRPAGDAGASTSRTLLIVAWAGTLLASYLILAITFGGEVVTPLVQASGLWQQWFGPGRSSWFLTSLGGAFLRLPMVLVPWVVLLLAGYRRRDYFLVRGELDAPAEPVRWLDIKPSQRWMQEGQQFASVFGLVILVVCRRRGSLPRSTHSRRTALFGRPCCLPCCRASASSTRCC